MIARIDPSTCTVSACVLCFNQADMIEETIRRVLAQTRRADEVLVLDDGSTDGSAAVIAAIPGILTLSHATNQGRPAARQHLLEAASGDVLIYVDGDAFAHPDEFRALLEEYGEADVGGVGGRGIETRLESRYDEWRRRHATQTWGDRPCTAPFLWGLSMSFPRAVIFEAGGFPRLGEDLDLSLRIRRLGYRLLFTPDAQVYHQRSDPDLASLLRMIYRWWHGSFTADTQDGTASLTRYFISSLSEFAKRCWRDLTRERSLRTTWINVFALATEIRSVFDAWLEARRTR